MPVANREPGRPGQLTSACTTNSITRDSEYEYLKGQSPIWAMLEAGLAIFAICVIARYLIDHLCSWFKLKSPGPPSSLTSTAQRAQGHSLALRTAWEMDEKIRNKGMVSAMKSQHINFGNKALLGSKNRDLETHSHGKDARHPAPQQLIARQPPAPPLTPPELSSAVFTLEERPRSQESFIHQPNPDYTFSAESPESHGGSASPSTPKKRFYNKTLPIGVPNPRQLTSGAESDPADLTFSPSSYPPTSPLLPPAPPAYETGDPDGSEPREVSVQGQILSLVDGDGAGWSRHTRVYGGGVCLACSAAGTSHGAGGFYGATVTPEEMR